MNARNGPRIIEQWSNDGDDTTILHNDIDNHRKPPQTLVGVAGSALDLPCNITAPTPDDSVALVLWYKDESTTPLYSLDARRGLLDQARHAASDLLNGRAYLSITHKPSTLKLKPLLEEDEGQYRCRVDFRKARTRNFDVLVTVVVPPKKPVIMDQNGELFHSLIGPYNEGDRLFLVCETEGGKPTPSLTWWRESVLLDDSYEVSSEGVVRNEIEITSLQRHDLMAVFTCQASNNNITVPVSKYVTVDMNFRPLEVSIEGNRRPLSANSPVELVCRATGSRPPATITWWKGNTKMKRTKERISIDGYVTTSILIFTPTSEDSGKYLSCRAENPLIPGSAIEDGWKLDINYVPQLTLRLGSKLRHAHIQEGNDVYFECNIRASPWVSEIGWKFEDQELHTNTSNGIIVSNQSLVLQKVQRSSRGRYTCTATNSEGTGESNEVFLRVQYAPLCKPGQKIIYGAARHEAVRVTCEVEADPREVSFHWQFNNTAESLEVVTFVNDGTMSTATYIPRTEFDYGTLLCWGTNIVGSQVEPCIYTIVPAGPPDSVENCSVTNQTEDSMIVECSPGYDGGLQQQFILEVHETALHRLQVNLSASSYPYFHVRGLPSGTHFVAVVYAANAKGRSQAVVMRTHTLPGPESQTRRENVWQVTFSPVLIVLVSVIIGFVVIAMIVVVVMKCRTRHERHKGQILPRKAYKLQPGLSKEEENNEAGKSPGEEKGPDIIPDVSIPSEQSAEEGLDKHFLADAASMQLMGVNGLGQTITTISRPPRQMELEPEATLRDYSHITPQKRVKVLPMDECGTLHRPYVKNIQTDV
ncbi:Nephrin [Araneus ventricosus]|uniref:Nephrin n=1 Tax=Araneus ventricosus TaxID=182803 RepID=A0A4Y2B3Y4_ARAVE|nr:Nephrin [Araneus ventricosus]